MKFIVCFSALLLIPVTTQAQTELLRATEGSAVGVEFLIPSFDTSPGLSYSGFIVVLSGNAAISQMISAKVEIPYVQSKTEFSGFGFNVSSSKGSVGNLYLGVGIGPANGTLSGEVGVRLPTFPEDNGPAAFSGFYGDFPAVERYLVQTTVIRAGLNFQPRVSDVVFFVTFHPSVWIPKGSGDSQWISYYGVGAAYEMDIFKVGAGVNGLWLMEKTGGFISANKKALHHFQIEGNARFGMVRPGVMIRFPLDKELKTTKFTLGLSVDVLL